MKKWMVLALLIFCSLNAIDEISRANPIPANQESFLNKIKKFLSPYLTYKKNFIGAQLAIIAAYETLSLVSYDYGPALSQMYDCKLLDSVLKKIKYDKTTFLILTENSYIANISSPCESNINIISMNREFYNNASEAEKTFVLGHEIIHAKHNHAEKKSIAAIGILLGTSSALIAYDKITQALFEKAEKILNLNKKSYCSRIFNFLKTSNHTVATSPLIHWFLSKYLYYKFSQSLEIEADKESALRLNCAQGGISFFENIIKLQKSSPLISYFNPFTLLELINSKCGFLNHPSDEDRIALLKKI